MKKLFIQTVWMLVALLATVSANAFTVNDISLEIRGISTSTASFESINEYISPSGKTFTTNGDIYVSGRFRNNTGSKIDMDASKFKIAFGYGESPYTSQVYSGGGGNITTISVWGYDYTDVIFKIPTNWKWHIKNNTMSFYFIYTMSNPIHFFNETYNITSSVVQTKAANLAKTVNYKIDGPDKLETNAVYSIVTTDGSALPVGLTATWDYPSDFYRINFTSTTIQLGRKTAEGYYTLSARLSNGTYVSKSIEAVKPVSPAPNPKPEQGLSQGDIRLDLYRISDIRTLGGDLLSSHTLSSGNSFVTTTGDIYVSGEIWNTTNDVITLDPTKILVVFTNGDSPYTPTVYNGGGEKLTSLTLPRHDYSSVIIKIPANWTYHTKSTSDNKTYLDFYFRYVANSPVLQLFTGSYCVTNGNNKSKAIEKESSIAVSYYDASNITVKSTDDSAIKSIRVIGTMGNLVKSQSYGNNCIETNFDLSNCKNGIYYIQVEKTNRVETAKIIKK